MPNPEQQQHYRTIDTWLKWTALVGPIFGFAFGLCAGALTTYQAFKNDTRRISIIENWKEKQDDFNKETITAIATLREVVKKIK